MIISWRKKGCVQNIRTQTLQAFSIVCYHCGPSHIATHAAVANDDDDDDGDDDDDDDDDKLFVDA